MKLLLSALLLLALLRLLLEDQQRLANLVQPLNNAAGDSEGRQLTMTEQQPPDRPSQMSQYPDLMHEDEIDLLG